MAEIKYNNLYNELTPMERRFYDQVFSQQYKPNQENLMLSSQPAYNEMKSVYEAQQDVPKKSLLDSLNLFSSASAAEKPIIPNLSLDYNTPTFDLGTGKGITNTSSALPFRSMVDMQEAANQDLVQQIIAENQAKTNPFVRPNMLDIAGGVVPGGITEIDLMEKNKLPYSGVGDMRYSTPRTIADQNRVLGQTFTEPKKSNGIFDLLMNIVMPGYNFIKNLGNGQPYERYTPGGTIRDGIYSIDGVNVPVSSFGGDFYNPNTGLNRFDRAAQRFTKTGSMADLFASSRTGKEFFEKRRQIQTQKQKALEDAAKAKRQFKQDTGGGSGGSRDNTGGDIGSKGAADRFSNTSGKGRTGY